MTSSGTFVANIKGWQLWTEFKAFRFVASFKQPLWKAFWVAVILGTFAAFIIQSVYILIDFFHFNVDTVVQLKSVKGLPFPAVTICNLNPIRKSAMDYVEELSDLQTIYKYLSQKKAHEPGNDTSSGTSRKKRTANDETFPLRELYDRVPMFVESYVKRRPKRQGPRGMVVCQRKKRQVGSSCNNDAATTTASPPPATTSTTTTTASPSTTSPTTTTRSSAGPTTTESTTTTTRPATTSATTSTPLRSTTSPTTISRSSAVHRSGHNNKEGVHEYNGTTSVRQHYNRGAQTLDGHRYDHNCGRDHHNRVHLELHETLHFHKGVVVDDKFGPCNKYDHDRLDRYAIRAHVDHDHRDSYKWTSNEHYCGGQLLNVDFDDHNFDVRRHNKHNSCWDVDQNRVHVQLHEYLHFHNGVVNDDELGHRFYHHRS